MHNEQTESCRALVFAPHQDDAELFFCHDLAWLKGLDTIIFG